MEPLFDWNSFFWLLIVLVFLYLILKFIGKVTQYVFKKNSTKRKLKRLFNTVLVIYIPVAIIVIILSFLSINFIMHGVLLLAVGFIFFSYIKSYLNGVVFKTNPLVDKEVFIVTGDFEGEIENLLSFGIIINLTEGKRFINYSYIEKKGFFISQHDEGTLRNTIYLAKSANHESVLDLLFENPLISLSHKPQIKDLAEKKLLKLQLTLEKGVQLETLINYLKQHDIESYISPNKQ